MGTVWSSVNHSERFSTFIFLCFFLSNILVVNCVPGLWPPVHSQRSRQPHAHLPAALYRPLQVLNPSCCSSRKASSYLNSTPRLCKSLIWFTQIQRASREKEKLIYVVFPYAQMFSYTRKNKCICLILKWWRLKHNEFWFFIFLHKCFVFMTKKGFAWQRK